MERGLQHSQTNNKYGDFMLLLDAIQQNYKG